MIIVKTPHRISLFGGGTDYPGWFLRRGGEIIAGAIDKYCYLTVRELPPFFEHRYRIVYRQVETVDHSEDIQHPVVRHAIEAFGLSAGLEIHHDGDLPARTGIGSSSAFAVGLIHALSVLNGSSPSPQDLASRAVWLERDVLREYGGYQDQYMSAFGGLINIGFHADGSISRRSAVSGNTELLQALQDSLILVYTGVKRNSSEVAAEFVHKLDAAENDSYLEEMMAITRKAQAILDEGNMARLGEIGALMAETWGLKQAMNSLAVTPEVKLLHAKAMAAGAEGGKISGAGGGGFCIFFVNPENRGNFLSAMSDYLTIPFRFVEHGSSVVYDSGERVFTS